MIPEEELTPFSLWIKNELQPFVDKVNISSKAMLGPALVVSPISSSMRQMAFMRELMEEKTKVNILLIFSLENQELIWEALHLSLTKRTS